MIARRLLLLVTVISKQSQTDALGKIDIQAKLRRYMKNTTRVLSIFF